MKTRTNSSCSNSRTMLSLVAALTLLSPLAQAHSWVEEYQIISDNGSFTGPRGYSRGYVPRTDPTYNGFSMMWMLPSLQARNADGTVRNTIDDTDLVCHPAQRTSNYTAAFPKLQVSPGDYVAMKYLENGHVSLPWNITGKSPGGGTVFVFGTTKPSDQEKIADVMQWNTAGTGGNGNGWLMTAQNFDDGRCHQINCGGISQSRQMLQPNHVAGQPTSTVESWCENDLLIPENITAGTLTTYWVWDFRTAPNRDCNTPAGKEEYYTTCADFDIVDKSKMLQIASEPAQSVPAAESNPQSMAVSDYKSRTAYSATPAYTPAPNANNSTNNKRSATATTTGIVDPAFVSSCSAEASVISANSLTLWPEVYVPNSCQVISTFGSAAASAWSATWDQAAAKYTSGAKEAWAQAFQKASLKVPTRVPWSAGPLMTAAPTGTGGASAPAGHASSSAPPSSGSGAGAEVTTIVTVVTLTSVVPVGQAVPSSPPASSTSSLPAAAVSSSSSVAAAAPPAYSAPASSSASAATNPTAPPTLPSPASGASSAADGVNIPTIKTVSGPGSDSDSDSASASAPSQASASSASAYAPSASSPPPAASISASTPAAYPSTPSNPPAASSAPVIPTIGTEGLVSARSVRYHDAPSPAVKAASAERRRSHPRNFLPNFAAH